MKRPHRGRKAVEEALIAAARQLLAESGPTVTTREIAARAGTNKGQIHHYFGSKQALIEAAFRSAAQEHFDNRQRREAEGEPELTLGQDQQYWQSLTRLVLDGDLETASLEFREGISVPKAVLGRIAADAGLDEPTAELKARFAASMAVELGWAAFAPFIERAIDAKPDELPQIIELLKDLAARGAPPPGHG